MTKIKCMLCGMVLEEEDYSIPLMRPRKGMDEQPDFFEGIQMYRSRGYYVRGLYFSGPLDNYSILYILTTHEQ